MNWPYHCHEFHYEERFEQFKRRRRRALWAERHNARPQPARMIRTPAYSGMNRAERRANDAVMRAHRVRS